MSAHAPVVPCPAALARAWRRLALSDTSPWLHQEVARRLLDKLQVIKLEPKDWIAWWAFAGAGTQVLRDRYPRAAGLVVEPTPPLLVKHQPSSGAKLLAWLARTGPLRYQLEQEPVPNMSADMLWANLVVHGVIDPQALFARWHAALRTDGFLMFSALGPDTLREWRDWAQRVGGPPPTLDFIDMHDLGDMLVQAGFADPVMDMERITLTWADAQAMLSDLRACGVNAHPGRFQGLRTPRWRDRLIADLSHQLRAPDGRLHLSFEVIYGHAIKPLPRVKMAAQTAVSLEAMRQMVKAKPHQSPDIRD